MYEYSIVYAVEYPNESTNGKTKQVLQNQGKILIDLFILEF